MNHYLNVFFEALHTASLVPLSTEATLYAMKAFGGYDLHAAVVAAVAGGVIGQMINWMIGKWLFTLRKPNGWNIPDTVYEKAKNFFNTYAVFLLLGSWATMGNLLVLVAGFLGAKPKMVIPLILVGYIFHYGLTLIPG